MQIFQVIWHCLMYYNSCVNPFIYNYSSKDFRDSFRDVVSRWTRSSSDGAAQMSGNLLATTRPQDDGILTGSQRGRLLAEIHEENARGTDELRPDELTVGGVYCGPCVERVELEVVPHATYV